MKLSATLLAMVAATFLAGCALIHSPMRPDAAIQSAIADYHALEEGRVWCTNPDTLAKLQQLATVVENEGVIDGLSANQKVWLGDTSQVLAWKLAHHPTPPADCDGDGVILANDQCLGTPPGVHVDETGCKADDAEVVLRGVTFEFDSAKLTNQAEARLNNVVAALQASPKVTFSIAGHTDAIGSNSYNKDLSQRRAKSVATYLVRHGVDANRITSIRGYGETRPVASNETEVGRAQNRRVELKVTNQ